MRLARKLAAAAAIVLLALVAYLTLWPVPIEPVPWTPGLAAPAKYRRNDGLAPQTILAPSLPGPEAVTFDPQGRLVTGLLDGRVVRLAADGTPTTLATTGGRPLGLKYDGAGNLIVCDAYKGLLSIAPDGAVTTLATEHGGVPFLFTDDLDVAADGTIYFTDASSRFPLSAFKLDVLEHRGAGRLLAYHPATKEVELVLDGLTFANGVALAADGSFVIVAETASYRVRRVWLAGPDKGRDEILLDDLPGFPDNVTRDGDRFWIGLGTPRDPAVDFMAERPFLRKVVARLPASLQPAPRRHSLAVAIDRDGKLLSFLEHEGADAYAPVASVLAHDGKLYLGSFMRNGIGVVSER